MITCDYCDEWFHGAYVNIFPTESLSFDKYKCAKCKEGARSDIMTLHYDEMEASRYLRGGTPGALSQ
ncbi:hypothetical protein DPMN_174602 [Dreissena polymorpha]|uniref:Uncharacterized protein n=1 Tax=Dreissena polymorpha TaxID=45954 RepID=A0A9D4E3N5_DREPO|nr:hypothetical protein DPMN_174602 [Dreissena polymorpha]